MNLGKCRVKNWSMRDRDMEMPVQCFAFYVSSLDEDA